MAAYNFQKQFVEPIQSGRKNCTIRRKGKRRHAKAGDPIQLYTGMRTKSCRKIRDPDPICLFVNHIDIHVMEDCIEFIRILTGHPKGKGSRELLTRAKLNKFAISDGFESIEDMHKFWLDFHGVGLFSGLYIGWERP